MFILLWNKNEFSEKMIRENPDIEACHSLIEVDNLIKKQNYQVETIKGVIILAELTWRKNTYTEFYGFEIAAILRQSHKLLCPFVIVSYLPQHVFEGFSNEMRYNILYARGTAFVTLPASAQKLKETCKALRNLSPAALKDISYLLLNKTYLLDISNHNIRFNKTALELDEIFGTLTQYLSPDYIQYEILQNYINQLKHYQEKGQKEDFYKKKKELIALLEQALQSIDAGQNEVLQKKFTILILDDNQNDLQMIMTGLSTYFHVLGETDVEKAIDILDDKSRTIHAVIADWRLYKPGTNYYQDLQGYEFLTLASKKGFFALFALTSLHDSAIHKIRNELSIQFTLLKKDFLFGNTWASYASIIQDKIIEQISLIASIPHTDSWTNNYKDEYKKNSKGKKEANRKYYKSLKEQYIEKRNSINWFTFEHYISKESNKLWNYYKYALSPDHDRSLRDIKTKWGIEINKELSNILIIRRVWMALWFQGTKIGIIFRLPLNEEHPLVEDYVISIYCILRDRYIGNISNVPTPFNHDVYVSDIELFKKLNISAKVFANQLSLESKKLPYKGILPEEKKWLQNQSIDIDKGNIAEYPDE